MGYAVAYPLGVVGAILSLLALKYILNIKTSQEEVFPVTSAVIDAPMPDLP